MHLSNSLVSFLVVGVRVVDFEHKRFAVLVTQLTSCIQHNTIQYNIRLLKPLSECRAHTIKLQVKNNYNIKMFIPNTEL